MRWREDRGSTAVETALVLPVALTILAGTLVFALHLVYAGLAEHAARSGLHRATVHSVGGFADTATIKQHVDDLFPAALLGKPKLLEITTTSPAATPGQGDLVQISVTYVVPGISTASDLLPNAALKNTLRSLATITRTASGRRE